MYLRKMKIEDYDNVYSLWMSCVGMGLNNLDGAVLLFEWLYFKMVE